MSDTAAADAIDTADVTQVNETPVLAQSILTLTEMSDNPSGFTIGLALASHSNGEAETFRIPVVDIILLAIVNTLRTIPAEFKAEIDRVNSAIATLGEKLEQGEFAEDAIAEFNKAVGVSAYVQSGN